jgi:hypothetical protein
MAHDLSITVVSGKGLTTSGWVLYLLLIYLGADTLNVAIIPADKNHLSGCKMASVSKKM